MLVVTPDRNPPPSYHGAKVSSKPQALIRAPFPGAKLQQAGVHRIDQPRAHLHLA